MTYIEAVGAGFPDVECHAVGDGSSYESIIWDKGSALPSKATLDAWIASNSTTVSSNALTSPILSFYSANITPQAGSTIIPYDSSVPQVTEGSQIWSQTVSPTTASSKFNIHFSAFIATGTGTRYPVAALFRGNVCIGVSTTLCSVANAPFQISLRVLDAPATLAATTYSLRFGTSASSTWYIAQTVTGSFAGNGAANVTVFETQ